MKTGTVHLKKTLYWKFIKIFFVTSKKNLPIKPELILASESDKFKIQIPTNNETTRIKKFLYLMPKIDFMPMMRKKTGIKYEE
tara:strand:+ start:82 stop:330 length:249 start_codon:yes stop_codon:yes gene_type:complete